VALIVNGIDADELLTTERAMEILEPVMLEEVAGTTFHLQAQGGGRTIRLVGGGLRGMGRKGVRVGNQALLYDTESGELLAIVTYRWGTLRVAATMALAARHLARPDARVVGLLGSGRNALAILESLLAVRPIECVGVFSPTPEHRAAFAERAAPRLGIDVVAHDTREAALRHADIVVVATNSRLPVLAFSDLRPGTHVTSMGVSTEIDESIFLRIDQLVAPSRVQEIAGARPGAAGGGGPLYPLVQEGRLPQEAIVQLGSIINGDVAPRNGPTDITLFRDSRGGVGDLAIANFVYEHARTHGLGVEVDV
jgi:ornithine cyclodeaminase/alanine dehydrogenase-like protein (mu-crystallin family)